MASVNPASPEIASELLLNKIMNGQVKTPTGKTITAAGRAMSSQLNAAGYQAGAAAGAVASGEGYVLAAQSQVTEMLSKLQEMRTVLGGVVGTTGNYVAAGKQAQELLSYIGKISGTSAKLNGKNLFSAAGMKLNAGMGVEMTVADIVVSLATGRLKSVGTVGGTTAGVKDKATADTKLAAIDAAINELNGYIAQYGSQYNMLRDRVEVLNSLDSGFKEAAAGQAINGTNGASSLLGSLLGATVS